VDFYIDWNALAFLMENLDQCRCIFHTHYYDVTTTMNDFHNLEEETNTIITHDAAQAQVIAGEETYNHGLSLANYISWETVYGSFITKM